MTVTLVGAAFVFEPTTDLVKWIFDYKLEEFPLLGIRNIVGVTLFILFIAIKFNQVD